MIIKCHFIFANLSQKFIFFFGIFLNFCFVIEFQNRGNKHDHGLLWIIYAPMYGVHTNEEIEWFIVHIFYDVSLIPNPL